MESAHASLPVSALRHFEISHLLNISPGLCAGAFLSDPKIPRGFLRDIRHRAHRSNADSILLQRLASKDHRFIIWRQIVLHNGRKNCLFVFCFADSLSKLRETESQHLGSVYVTAERYRVKEFHRAVGTVTAIDLERITAARVAR